MQIFWTPDSKAFDYVTIENDRDEIRRVSIDENAERQTVREFPRRTLFNIARAADGRSVAAARGQLRFDAVLLTTFE